MPLSVQIPCPAKVNLFLEITGKRRDGYHLLDTLFLKLGLCDDLHADAADEGFELEVEDEAGQGLSAGEDNLVLRAAEAFKREFGLGMGARFRLVKRIPMGAGLGGGSSDAAGAMIALARLYRMDQDRSVQSKMKKIAAALGADIPFFLRREALCKGKGIGDKLTVVETAAALPWMVVVFPSVHIGTPEVYKALKRPDKKAVLTRLSQLDKLKKKLEKGRPIAEWGGLLFNRLEEVVLEAKPEVQQARSILSRTGLKGVLMSGSGASVFGFADSREEAEGVAKKLEAYPWKVFLTSSLG